MTKTGGTGNLLSPVTTATGRGSLRERTGETRHAEASLTKTRYLSLPLAIRTFELFLPNAIRAGKLAPRAHLARIWTTDGPDDLPFAQAIDTRDLPPFALQIKLIFFPDGSLKSAVNFLAARTFFAGNREFPGGFTASTVNPLRAGAHGARGIVSFTLWQRARFRSHDQYKKDRKEKCDRNKNGSEIGSRWHLAILFPASSSIHDDLPGMSILLGTEKRVQMALLKSSLADLDSPEECP